MSHTPGAAALDPADPGSWSELPFETLFALSKEEVEGAQREALAHRFDTLRPRVVALDNLASRQGVERIEGFDDAVPVFFDHRVYKSYPLGLIEQRKFDRLTAWLGRLTMHDLTSVPLDGVSSVDSWLDRLNEETLMSVGHTTGTSGKLSFLPRSESEWPAWSNAFFEVQRALTGYDLRTESVASFRAGYRREHYWVGKKLNRLTSAAQASRAEDRHYLYDYDLSPDLLSMAARLQQAEERGELDDLDIDPKLLAQRAQVIERSRHRQEDLQQWFIKLADDYRGRRVSIGGTGGDMVELVRQGAEWGVVCEFAPGSFIFSGGGMKAVKDAPVDWQQLVKDFFGIDRIVMTYGMSEAMSMAPRCEKGFYHFFPYMLPILLDEDFVALPREGVQTGRMALFDFLPETYWGGFISGDRVTMYWDHACECGWTGPRIDGNIARFAQLEGVQDDKITCAGSPQAYTDFMDYVSGDLR